MSEDERIIDGSGSPTRRWPLAIAVAVVVMAVLAVGLLVRRGRDTPTDPAATSGPSSATTVASVPGQGPGVTFRVVWKGSIGEEPGSLRVITTRAEAEAIWETNPSLSRAMDAPPAAFSDADTVLVIMTISRRRCPAVLQRFVVDGMTLQPVFVDSNDTSCPVGPTDTTYITVLDWDSIGPAMRLLLTERVSHGAFSSSADAQRPTASSATTG